MDFLTNWLLGKLNELSFWVAIIALVLLALGFHTLLAVLLFLLIILPDTQLTSWVKFGADKVKKNL